MVLLKIILLTWLGLGIAPIVFPRHRSILHFHAYLLILAALGTLALSIFYSGASAFLFNISFVSFPFTFALQFDALSRFFVFLLSLSALAVMIFGQSYFQHFTLKQQSVLQSALPIFMLAMLGVLTAGNAFTFLFAWELMALSSYFLVILNDTGKSICQTGFLYFGIAHLGFLGIASGFFLLGDGPLTVFLANVIFILTFIGFGAKAGLFPLHVWLPEAHPAAPSPISALMSGVMLKTAVYGLIRFSFYWLLPYQQAWWGYSLIVIGLSSMLVGVIHASLQTDMKRLLAYSSMENLGFIVMSLGFAIVFYQYHQYGLADVALLIVLLHSLSHSLFKSLLFLGTGCILHATSERNIGKLGGLIQKMPWVGVFTLIGCLSMAGLPLFSGFISEWLYLRIFFAQGTLVHFNFSVLSSVIAAISVLVFGLAGFVIVKFFGIAFLGQPRESQLVHAKPAAFSERLGLAWLALWSLGVGLCPLPFVSALQKIVHAICDQFILPWPHLFKFALAQQQGVAHQGAFVPLFLLLALIVFGLFIFLLIKSFAAPSVQRNSPWGCGFNVSTSRMQESAEGFSQPFEQIFEKLIRAKRVLPKPSDLNPRYSAQVTERIWDLFYGPLTQGVFRIVALTRWIQQGKIAVYLSYMALTLFILLVGVLWL